MTTVSTGGLDAYAPYPAAPAPAPRTRPGRHLRPVGRPAPRRSPAVPVLVATGIVLAALFGLAVMHALLIGGQIHLDKMQRQAASETEEVRQLRLQVAELESPDRVLDVARTRLGMVEATEVGYLLPAGVDTGDDTLVRVDPAEPPPPPEPTTSEETGTASPASASSADGTDAGTATDPTSVGPADGGIDPADTSVVAADGSVAEEPIPSDGAGGDDE